MGLSNLSRVCVAVLFAPAIALANDVRVGVSPTTGYYSVTSSTFSVPKGATVSSSTAVSPVVTPLAGGGFQQSMGGGITIEGLKKPAPFTARAAAGLSTMKNGAKKLAKSNPARFLAGAGLVAFLDSLDWLVEDGSIAKKTLIIPELIPDSSYGTTTTGQCRGSVSDCSFQTYIVGPLPNNPGWWRTCSLRVRDAYLMSYSGTTCYYRSGGPIPPILSPVSDSEIDDSIDSRYTPGASDFVLLTPHMTPDYLIIDPIPPVDTVLSITTKYDSEGLPAGIEEKTSTTDFSISNNSTSSPSISASTSIKTESFVNGQSQGSTVTDTTFPAAGSGGGGSPPVELDIPTDCDFMPTVCAFLDWFKDDNLGDDPDLKSIMKDDEDFEKTKTISFGSAVCPAPHTIHIPSLGMSVDLSFDFFCQFAIYAKALVLAAAYIFAAYISLGVARG